MKADFRLIAAAAASQLAIAVRAARFLYGSNETISKGPTTRSLASFARFSVEGRVTVGEWLFERRSGSE
jgi:hypothetical protein